jgi:hypothetical protein
MPQRNTREHNDGKRQDTIKQDAQRTTQDKTRPCCISVLKLRPERARANKKKAKQGQNKAKTREEKAKAKTKQNKVIRKVMLEDKARLREQQETAQDKTQTQTQTQETWLEFTRR